MQISMLVFDFCQNVFKIRVVPFPRFVIVPPAPNFLSPRIGFFPTLGCHDCSSLHDAFYCCLGHSDASFCCDLQRRDRYAFAPRLLLPYPLLRLLSSWVCLDPLPSQLLLRLAWLEVLKEILAGGHSPT